MNRRDRTALKVCDLVLKLATAQTRARVLAGLYRAQGLLVPPDIERRADFPQERTP